MFSVDPVVRSPGDRLAWWTSGDAASCHAGRVNIATLVVSLVALLIAYLALRHERTASTAHGMFFTVRPIPGIRREEDRIVTDIAGWHVTIEMVGPVPAIQAQPVVFVEGDSSLVKSVTDRKLVPVWSPGDENLEVTIVRTSGSAMPDEVWVGVTWAEPVPYGRGLISRVRRWPVRVKGQGASEVRSQRWSHWGRGRWKVYRRPFWQPAPTNRWEDELEILPLRK